jgi:hypothetical protein
VVTIPYRVAEGGRVSIEVYDAAGRRRDTLVDRYHNAHRYEAVYDTSGLASGTYFLRLTAGTFTETQTLVVLH